MDLGWGERARASPGSPQCHSWRTSQQHSQDRCRPIQSSCSWVILAGGAAWGQRHGVMRGSQLHSTHMRPFPPVTLGPRSQPTPPPKLRGARSQPTPPPKELLAKPWVGLGLGWGGLTVCEGLAPQGVLGLISPVTISAQTVPRFFPVTCHTPHLPYHGPFSRSLGSLCSPPPSHCARSPRDWGAGGECRPRGRFSSPTSDLCDKGRCLPSQGPAGGENRAPPECL